MRQAGRITTWNYVKGFGFVTPHDGGSRAFVHINAFQGPMHIPRLATGLAFLLLAFALMVTGKVPAVIALGYLLMSGVSYIAYVVLDKDAAGKPRCFPAWLAR